MEATATDTASTSNIETPLLDGVVDGFVDYKGCPAVRSKSGGWRSACFIIGVEVAERISYHGISSNLITYLTGPLGQSTATAAENVNAWSGTASLLPLFGAFVGDAFLGRYRTILIATSLYILALAMLTFSSLLPSSNCETATSCPPPQSKIILFYISLYVVAFAQGGLKPCGQAFVLTSLTRKTHKKSNPKARFSTGGILDYVAAH